MLTRPNDPFKYFLAYKYSQDHIELLFSCIRSKGGWNNNPNCLQLKYALRQMLMKNAVTASQNANCMDFTDSNNTIIPIFHTRKHKSPLTEMSTQDQNADIPDAGLHDMEQGEENLMFEHLDQNSHSDIISNILFYIGGFIVSNLVKKLTCVKSLVGEITPSKVSDHNYCGSSVYSEVSSASVFTMFVNNGGLRIPSKSVFTTIEQCEHIFKRYVCQKGNSISNTENLKSKMIIDVCHHFLLESNRSLFTVHEPNSNEDMVDDHRIKLMKWTADKYFTLRLFTYGKHYTK